MAQLNDTMMGASQMVLWARVKLPIYDCGDVSHDIGDNGRSEHHDEAKDNAFVIIYRDNVAVARGTT